ncbi:MAG: GNAT family N-acetyltransferase [Promethearchaeota archaeon]
MNLMKNLDFSIRPCTYDDIASVMDVNETTLPENYPLFFYEQILEKYPKTFILAHKKEDPKQIIGYIMWRVEKGSSSFGLNYVKKAHLVSLAVLQAFRRQGIAHELLLRSMDLIREFKISEYVLEVRVSNSGAIKLYQDLHDFKKIRIIGHYYRDGEDAFYMAAKNQEIDDINKIKGKKDNIVKKIGFKRNFIDYSVGMTDNEIKQHFLDKNQGYLLYNCPNCKSLLIKGLSYSLPGTVDPNNTSTLVCANCGKELSLYDISMGKFNSIK